MDNKMILDFSLCFFALSFVILPRFNKWPEKEFGRFSGQPKDYINDRLYWRYATIYLATFVGFMLALRGLKDMNTLLVSLGFSDDIQKFLGLIQQFLGNESFFLFLMIVLGLLAVPQVATIDQRWRSALLRFARVPKEVHLLKQQLLEACDSDFAGKHMAFALDKVRKWGNSDVWTERINKSSKTDPDASLVRSLLKVLCVASLNRTFFELSDLDAKDLSQTESRMLEIAAVIPTFTIESNPTLHQKYQKEIEQHLGMLLEMLAKKFVKHYPDRNKRYAALARHGLRLNYLDQKRVGVTVSLLVAIISILACSLLTVMLFLLALDTIGLKTPPRMGDMWFSIDRSFHWALGGTVSYIIAAFFGLFFNEVMKDRLNFGKAAVYLLSFVFGTLGSCIFFLLSKEVFKQPYIWLAISFGLISIVIVESRGRDMTDSEAVNRKALQLCLLYGLASALLQMVVHIGFRQGAGTTFLSLAAFFLFGFLRGASIAFILAIILMSHERARVLNGRREYPRMLSQKRVEGLLAGEKADVFVKDLSEQGACIRFANTLNPKEGDEVALRLGSAQVKGKVYWAKTRLARVKFDPQDSGFQKLDEIIGHAAGASV